MDNSTAPKTVYQPAAQNFGPAPVTLQLLDVDIIGPDLTVINPPSSAQEAATPGLSRIGTLTHWCDLDLANAWFAEAQRLSNIALAAYSGPGAQDPGTKSTPSEIYNLVVNPQATSSLVTQGDAGTINGNINAVCAAMYALMQGYNALNIPWYMDPVARALWRQYMAGPPELYGGTGAGSWQSAVYGNYNYNSTWFVNGQNMPGFSAGQIPTLTYGLWSALTGGALSVGNPNSPWFVASLWPTIVTPFYGRITGNTSVNPIYEPVAVNYAAMGGMAPPILITSTDEIFDIGQTQAAVQILTNYYAMPVDNYRVYLTPTGNPVGQNFLDHSGNNNVFGQPNLNAWNLAEQQGLYTIAFPSNTTWVQQGNPAYLVGEPSVGQFLSNSSGTWLTFTFDQSNSTLIGSNAISPAHFYYVPWIRDWVAAILSRSVDQIAVAGRLYAVYCNVQSSINTTWPGGFLTAATGLPAATLNAPAAVKQEMLTGATTSLGIGGALAVPTYGISLVVGAGVAAGLAVAASNYQQDPNANKDDLGRYKPVLERGALSGTIGANAQAPNTIIAAPQGWVRPGTNGVPPTPFTGLNPIPFVSNPTSSMTTINGIQVGVVTVTGADGTVTQTTTNPDGSMVSVAVSPNGTITQTTLSASNLRQQTITPPSVPNYVGAAMGVGLGLAIGAGVGYAGYLIYDAVRKAPPKAVK